MLKVSDESALLQDAIKTAPQRAWTNIKGTWQAWKTPAEVVEIVEKSPGRLARAGAWAGEGLVSLGSGIGKLFVGAGKLGGMVVGAPVAVVGGFVGEVGGTSARAGMRVVEAPIALAMKPVRGSINLVSKYPIVAGVMALATGATFMGVHSRKAAAQRTQATAMGEVMQAQATANTNVYQTSPADYAAMEAQMRTGGKSSHADNIIAAREQQAQASAAATPVVAG